MYINTMYSVLLNMLVPLYGCIYAKYGRQRYENILQKNDQGYCDYIQFVGILCGYNPKKVWRLFSVSATRMTRILSEVQIQKFTGIDEKFTGIDESIEQYNHICNCIQTNMYLGRIVGIYLRIQKFICTSTLISKCRL